MSCAFDLRHYRELIEAAGAYTWATFDREPRAGDLFLRHDVDLSLDAALVMARLESELGARATYLLMPESRFYNLGSHDGRDAIAELRHLGHPVGLHAAYPNMQLDDRFDPVIAWHNPDPDHMSKPVAGAVNVMAPPWFAKGHYRSDSNQHWREGCPHDELAAGSFEWLQLLIHPEIWVYEGMTMRETMEKMLEAKRDEFVEALIDDRVDMT
ncbi:MAG: hypothetical protein JOY72_07715 [Actinobacteria bacterium]|nr:hypothetical protein [Actinomycetota bacterium]